MIEFSALGILLLMLADAWSEKPVSGLRLALGTVASLGALFCLVLAIITAPWGEIL